MKNIFIITFIFLSSFLFIASAETAIFEYEIWMQAETSLDIGPIEVLGKVVNTGTAILDREEEGSALAINGKKNQLKREDFDKVADYLNIPIKIRYEKFEKSLKLMETIIKNSEIKAEAQVRFINIIKERLLRMDLAEE